MPQTPPYVPSNFQTGNANWEFNMQLDTISRMNKVFQKDNPYITQVYQPKTNTYFEPIFDLPGKKVTNGKDYRDSMFDADPEVAEIAREKFDSQSQKDILNRVDFNTPYYVDYDQAKKYLNKDFGYRVDRDNEDYYYKNEYLKDNWFVRNFVKNPAKFVARVIPTAILKLGEGLGYLGSMITSVGSENYWADVADNGFSRWLEGLEENYKNNVIPIYKQAGFDEKGFFKKLGDWSFWNDEVADGVAFMASVMAPSLAISKIGLLGRGISTGTKLGKIASAVGIEDYGQLSMWALNTAMESGHEAAQVFKQKKQMLELARERGEIDDSDELIREKAGKAAKNTMLANFAVLGASNLLENKFIFNPILKRLRGGQNQSIRSSLITNQNSQFGRQSFSYGTKLGKFIDYKNPLSRFSFYGKRALATSAMEGFWEENAQLAVERLSIQDKLNIDTFLSQLGTQTLNALSGNDPEASESIGLGALIGIMGTGAVTKAFSGNKFLQGERRAVSKNTNDAIDSLNEYRNKFLSYNDIYVTDSNGNVQIDEDKLLGILEGTQKHLSDQERRNNVKNPYLARTLQNEALSDYVFAATQAGLSMDNLLEHSDPEIKDSAKKMQEIYENIESTSFSTNKNYTPSNEIQRKKIAYKSFTRQLLLEDIINDHDFNIVDFNKNLDPSLFSDSIQSYNYLNQRELGLQEFEDFAKGINGFYDKYIKEERKKITKLKDNLEKSLTDPSLKKNSEGFFYDPARYKSYSGEELRAIQFIERRLLSEKASIDNSLLQNKYLTSVLTDPKKAREYYKEYIDWVDIQHERDNQANQAQQSAQTTTTTPNQQTTSQTQPAPTQSTTQNQNTTNQNTTTNNQTQNTNPPVNSTNTVQNVDTSTTSPILDDIEAKYDRELAALEQPVNSQVSSTTDNIKNIKALLLERHAKNLLFSVSEDDDLLDLISDVYLNNEKEISEFLLNILKNKGDILEEKIKNSSLTQSNVDNKLLDSFIDSASFVNDLLITLNLENEGISNYLRNIFDKIENYTYSDENNVINKFISDNKISIENNQIIWNGYKWKSFDSYEDADTYLNKVVQFYLNSKINSSFEIMDDIFIEGVTVDNYKYSVINVNSNTITTVRLGNKIIPFFLSGEVNKERKWVPFLGYSNSLIISPLDSLNFYQDYFDEDFVNKLKEISDKLNETYKTDAREFPNSSRIEDYINNLIRAKDNSTLQERVDSIKDSVEILQVTPIVTEGDNESKRRKEIDDSIGDVEITSPDAINWSISHYNNGHSEVIIITPDNQRYSINDLNNKAPNKYIDYYDEDIIQMISDVKKVNSDILEISNKYRDNIPPAEPDIIEENITVPPVPPINISEKPVLEDGRTDNEIDDVVTQAKKDGTFVFVQNNSEEISRIDGNVMLLKTIEGDQKDQLLRQHNVLKKYSLSTESLNFMTEENGERKFRIKLMKGDEKLHEKWVYQTAKGLKNKKGQPYGFPLVIATIVDNNGKNVYFDLEGNITSVDKGEPVAFVYSVEEYKQNNINISRKGLMTRTFEPLGFKANYQNDNPLSDIQEMINKNIDVYGTILFVTSGKLSGFNVTNSPSVYRQEEYKVRTIAQMIKDGDINEGDLPTVFKYGYYFENIEGKQKIKKGQSYIYDAESRLNIAVTGNKVKDLTINGNKLFNDTMISVMEGFQTDGFIDSEGVNEEDFLNLFNFLRTIFYSSDIQIVINKERTKISYIDNRAKIESFLDYNINFSDLDMNNAIFSFNLPFFNIKFSYKNFVKENFYSGAIKAKISENNTTFEKVNKRIVFMLNLDHNGILGVLNKGYQSTQTSPEVNPDSLVGKSFARKGDKLSYMKINSYKDGKFNITNSKGETSEVEASKMFSNMKNIEEIKIEPASPEVTEEFSNRLVLPVNEIKKIYSQEPISDEDFDNITFDC